MRQVSTLYAFQGTLPFLRTSTFPNLCAISWIFLCFCFTFPNRKLCQVPILIKIVLMFLKIFYLKRKNCFCGIIIRKTILSYSQFSDFLLVNFSIPSLYGYPPFLLPLTSVSRRTCFTPFPVINFSLPLSIQCIK